VVPNCSCLVEVTFTPSEAGLRSAALELTFNAAGSPRTIALTGTGVASTFSVSPTNVRYGKVRIGATKAGSVTVRNTGTIAFVPTTAVSSDPAFVVQPSPNCLGVPLAPGRTCTVNVSFTPTATGNVSGSLTVSGDKSSRPMDVTVNMTGTGR
jgi:hypothetical protein